MHKCTNVPVCLRQCGDGWRFTRGVAVSLGTLWWKCGGSCRGRRIIFSSHPACLWGDAAAAVLTKPWSAFPCSRTRSPWRYMLRHTHTLQLECWSKKSNNFCFLICVCSWWELPSWSTSSSSCRSLNTASVSAGNKSAVPCRCSVHLLCLGLAVPFCWRNLLFLCAG